MIRELFTALGREHAGQLRTMLISLVVSAVLQGLAFALLVPVLQALLGGDADGAWQWLGALAVVWLCYAVSSSFTRVTV